MSYTELEQSTPMAIRQPRKLRPDQPNEALIALQNRAAQRGFQIAEYVTKSRIIAVTLGALGLTSLVSLCMANAPYPVESIAKESCQKIKPTLYEVSRVPNDGGLAVYRTFEESTNPDNIVGRFPLGHTFGAVTVLTNRGTLTLSCEPGYLGMINSGGLTPSR